MSTTDLAEFALWVEREKHEIMVIANCRVATAARVLQAVNVAAMRGVPLQTAMAQAKRLLAVGLPVQTVIARIAAPA